MATSPRIFDFHTHVYPIPDLPFGLQSIKKGARSLIAPWTRQTQALAAGLRRAPVWARGVTEELSMGYLMSHLLIESSFRDFEDACRKSGIDGALLVAHPPLIPNSFIQACAKDRPHLIPAWQFPFLDRGAPIDAFVADMKANGVRVLKIHPMADGFGPEDERYRALLDVASKEGWLVVLHSGVVRSHLAFQDPKLGDPRLFFDWFRQYPKVNFVVAHFNIHDPEQLLDIDLNFDNVWWTLSWQTAGSMGRAIEKLGAERLLFASDWPLLGGNQQVIKDRLIEAMNERLLDQDERALIWSGNAKTLLSQARAWKAAW
ncbi:MAG: amidohydrolase family protein [Bdellovibrionaceae bacterium]|nr:amidohydrolase family protein [Pseudobdellovibrionaceae bacterium]